MNGKFIAENIVHSLVCRFAKNDSNTEDDNNMCAKNVRVEANAVYYGDSLTTRKFPFDVVYDKNVSQETFFSILYEKIKIAFIGITVTCIAFGSSGAGKTYTLIENGNDECASDGDIGFIGRILKRKLVENDSNEKIYISSCEISLKGVRDLYSKKSAATVEETPFESMRRIQIKKIEDIHTSIATLRMNRMTTLTELNDQSSRSHMMVKIDILSSGGDQFAKLVFMDLAGFEPISNSDTKITTFINSSLAALQGVLTSFVKRDDKISFRNSLLTRLMKPYLHMESKIVLMAAVKMTKSTLRGDLNTLRISMSKTDY